MAVFVIDIFSKKIDCFDTLRVSEFENRCFYLEIAVIFFYYLEVKICTLTEILGNQNVQLGHSYGNIEVLSSSIFPITLPSGRRE